MLRPGATSGLVLRLRGQIEGGIVDQEVETISVSSGMTFPGVVELPPEGGREGKEEADQVSY